MQLTWQDLKDSVRKLCFLTQSEYAGYDEAITEAANYALVDMAKDFPLTEIYTFTRESEDSSGYETYDLLNLTMEDMRFTFLGVCERDPVIRIGSDGLIETPEYALLADRFLLIPKKACGTYKVMYKKDPERITAQTSNDYVIPYASCAANLLPLLMAWRVLKDDDERKASMYYNEYINGKDSLKNIKGYVYPVQITAGVKI